VVDLAVRTLDDESGPGHVVGVADWSQDLLSTGQHLKRCAARIPPKCWPR
jgi:hypothetical protein